jgi:hypothetical protein
VKIPCLSRRLPRVLPRSAVSKLGGAGSLAGVIAGIHKSERDRYHYKNAEPCASCAKNKHQCVSLHCPCKRCNPEVKL